MRAEMASTRYEVPFPIEKETILQNATLFPKYPSNIYIDLK